MTDQTWTSRRRVTAALNHQEPDRVPYDLGGTILTGIHEKAYRRLRQYLGLPEAKIEIEDPIQQLARVNRAASRLQAGAKTAMTSWWTNGALNGGNRRTAGSIMICAGILWPTLT